MEIINIKSKPPIDDTPLILMIGKFDGIHMGHEAIINKANEYKGEGEKLAMLSFSDHPLWVLEQDPEFKDKITPDLEKVQLIKKYGVQRFYRVQFTEEYAAITAEAFVLEHLARLNIKRIVVGEGFRFGYRGKGGTEELIELASKIQAEVTVVPQVLENGNKLSSSTIREHIKFGRMEAVQNLLGRPYSMTGKVVHGQKLGRTLGFPTINLGELDDYVLPKPGVYLGTVGIHAESDVPNEYWNVLISAGYRPTVEGKEYLVEAYILNYSGDLYDKIVTISFLRFLRGEIKFSGLDSLVKQMEMDKQQAEELLKSKQDELAGYI